MITNLSTAPVKCSQCTLFSETNTVRGAKKRGHPASPQTPWKLHDQIESEYCRYFPAYLLIIVCFDDITQTSQFASIAELKQALVSAWQQLSQALIDKSINEWRRCLECVVYSRMGAISNTCSNN